MSARLVSVWQSTEAGCGLEAACFAMATSFVRPGWSDMYRYYFNLFLGFLWGVAFIASAVVVLIVFARYWLGVS
jgi:hypothetical protein